MFSVFDYLRRLIRDSVLAGVQDAFEIMDQGDQRDAVSRSARQFLERAGGPPAPAPLPAPQPAPPRAEPVKAPEPARAQVPPAAAGELVPGSFQIPPAEIPRIDGYEGYERRKKGHGRPQKPQGGAR